ncbi:MAG: hypothetical protein K6T91_08665 [Firmicutes bacterium]|nr:hypothetical protein [Bacillota bacterium]
MAIVNSLSGAVSERFGDQARIDTYNILYDDTDEIEPLITRIRQDLILLPAVFIGDELIQEGQIDKSAIIKALERRGLRST